MRFISGISQIEPTPLTFQIEKFTEETSIAMKDEVINKAKEVLDVISEELKKDWSNKPSTKVRMVYGHWFFNAYRHFRASIILCQEFDLSIVTNVHHRQIFEIFLQVRYYSLLNQEDKELFADKIKAIGYMEYLEKMNITLDNDFLKRGYEEISDSLEQFDIETVKDIIKKRKDHNYYWFGSSFSQLAKRVNRNSEDLSRAYQLISTDVHGSWSLAFDVQNLKPGILDFRGYPDRTTINIRTSEMLYQITTQYMDIWNEIAESVGAQPVKFLI